VPLQTIIFEDARLVITQAHGAFNRQDLLSNRESLLKERAFDPAFDHLFDLRATERVELSPTDVQQASLIRAFSESSRRAIVAPRDITFGLSRMYEAHREDIEELIRVFRDMDDALRWLGRDPEDPLFSPLREPLSPEP